MIKILFGLVNIVIIISLLLIVGNLILVLGGDVSFFFPFLISFFVSLTLSFILDNINTKKEKELAREAAIKAEKQAIEAEKKAAIEAEKAAIEAEKVAIEKEKITIKAEKKIIDQIYAWMKANKSHKSVKGLLNKIRSGKWPNEWSEINEWITTQIELEAIKKKERFRIAVEKRREKERKAQEKANKLCTNDEQMESYKKGKICLDMHMDVVSLIHGRKYDEKRTISKEKEILKYKYGKYKSSRGNTKYKLQVTYIDDRVDSFKDLD